jgi:hypothetical protein
LAHAFQAFNPSGYGAHRCAETCPLGQVMAFHDILKNAGYGVFSKCKVLPKSAFH